MMQRIGNFSGGGGSIFISGAYIGTDMVENADSAAIHFAENVLHFSWRTNHATNVGLVSATSEAGSNFPNQLRFNTTLNEQVYKVESPDAIEPAGKGAFRIYRYDSGSRSAGIAYKGDYRTVVLGFPFETIISAEQREEMMKDIMGFFEK
jgi:hypothetical protein